jgi:hypothetical protein
MTFPTDQLSTLSIHHGRIWALYINISLSHLPRSIPFTMSGSDHREGSSGSPQRLKFNGFDSFAFNSQTAVRQLPSLAHPVSPFNMPNPERIQYSNKESAKVNAGIDTAHGMTNVRTAFSTNMPVVHIDFSQLSIPIVQAEPKPSTEALVHRLLNPPRHAFVHGMISMHWVIGALGREHIAFRNSDERYVLARDSGLRKELSIPALYLEWLCGDNEDASATELGVYLTPEYFDEIEA